MECCKTKERKGCYKDIKKINMNKKISQQIKKNKNESK